MSFEMHKSAVPGRRPQQGRERLYRPMCFKVLRREQENGRKAAVTRRWYRRSWRIHGIVIAKTTHAGRRIHRAHYNTVYLSTCSRETLCKSLVVLALCVFFQPAVSEQKAVKISPELRTQVVGLCSSTDTYQSKLQTRNITTHKGLSADLADDAFGSFVGLQLTLASLCSILCVPLPFLLGFRSLNSRDQLSVHR